MGKILTIVLLFAALPLGVLHAGTYTVNTTTDAHSNGYNGSPGSPGTTATAQNSSGQYTLRSVLEYASSVGGTTTINLPAGTYNLSLGDLIAGATVNTTININGAGATSTIIRQTVSGDLIFNANYFADVVVTLNVNNVTVTGGSENPNDLDGFGGNGGAILAGGTNNVLSLTNVVFTNNFCDPSLGGNAGASGGAIDMTGGGNLNVVNCTFINNNASKGGGLGYGGAIDFDNSGVPGDSGNAVISGSYFSNNIAPGAGGGALDLAGGSSGSFTVTGCTFVNNSCVSGTTYGGAIYLETGKLTGSYNRFRGNSAANGGAVYVSNNAGTTGNLTDNWWGANNGPNAAGADTTVPTTSSSGTLSAGQIAFSPWLELKSSINENPLTVGNSATVTASFLTNSSGQTVSAANVAPLVGLPVTWTSSGGTLQSSQLTIQTGATATTTFDATTAGTGKVEAQVDGVVANDANATVSFTINSPPPPVFSSPNSTNFLVGSFGSFQVQASGLPAWGESGALPGGVTFNTANGLLSGIPAIGSGGVYPVTFSAQNSGGTTPQTFTLTVDQQPSITPPANVVTNAANGVCTLPVISFAASATGYPAPVINCQLGSSAITSPTAFPLGTNIVTCTATNSVGTNSGNFTVTVLPGTAPQLTVVNSGGNVLVLWPTNFNCYSLQTAPVLASNQWQDFSGIVGIIGTNFVATNAVSGSNAFFQLAH